MPSMREKNINFKIKWNDHIIVISSNEKGNKKENLLRERSVLYSKSYNHFKYFFL